MIAGVVAATAILALPPALMRPSQPPGALVLVQVLAAGAVLGIGRQGIDMLLIRALAAATLMLATLSVVGDVSVSQCGGIGQCGWLAVLILIGALFLAAVLGVVAVPTAALWSRGLDGLRPEGAWRVLRPRTARHLFALIVGVAGLLVGLDLFLGIPSY